MSENSNKFEVRSAKSERSRERGRSRHFGRRAARCTVATMCAFLCEAMIHAPSAFGCAACAGQSDDLQAQGMNWGIYTLLGVIAVVMGSVATFFVCLAKRAAANPLALPDPAPDVPNEVL